MNDEELEAKRQIIDDWLRGYQRGGRKIGLVGTKAAQELLEALEHWEDASDET